METGLIAAAAFGVGVRRQLRTVGFIGAAGGEPRHVRLLVFSAGTMLGLFGSFIRVILGIGVAFAVSPVSTS